MPHAFPEAVTMRVRHLRLPFASRFEHFLDNECRALIGRLTIGVNNHEGPVKKLPSWVAASRLMRYDPLIAYQVVDKNF
jgi:hypothetical protein